MLTKTQRQYLKGLANTLKPLVQIGKNGLTENVIKSVDEVLEAHELLKVDVLPSCEETSSELAVEIAGATGSEIISRLGRKIVLYRHNRNKPQINLPR